MARIDNVENPSLLFEEQASAPTSPTTGFWRLFFKAGGLYTLDDAGTETPITADVSGQYAVNTVAAAGPTEAVPATSSAHHVTMDQDCTFTFDAPSQDGHTFLLLLAGSFTPTFPASVDWADAAPPTYATPSLYAFSTLDGGTTWLGSLIGSSFG